MGYPIFRSKVIEQQNLRYVLMFLADKPKMYEQLDYEFLVLYS